MSTTVRRQERPPRDSGRNGLAVDVFHDDELKTVAFTDVVNSGDIRMIQRGRRAGFTLEALHPIRVPCQVPRENLERDGPIEPRVAREINLTHAAGAKQGHDLIVAERSASSAFSCRSPDQLRRQLHCRPFQK